jgi:biopolymer transport protein ExbD
VGLDSLSDTLRTYFQANPLGTVILNASRTSSYNDVVQLLDAMRQVGGDRVALATIAGSVDRPAGSTLSPATIPTTPYTSIPGQSLINQAIPPLQLHPHPNLRFLREVLILLPKNRVFFCQFIDG